MRSWPTPRCEPLLCLICACRRPATNRCAASAQHALRRPAASRIRRHFADFGSALLPQANRPEWIEFVNANSLGETGNDPGRHTEATRAKFWASVQGGGAAKKKAAASSDSDSDSSSSSDEDKAKPAPKAAAASSDSSSDSDSDDDAPAKKAAPVVADSSDSSSSSDEEEAKPAPKRRKKKKVASSSSSSDTTSSDESSSSSDDDDSDDAADVAAAVATAAVATAAAKASAPPAAPAAAAGTPEAAIAEIKSNRPAWIDFLQANNISEMGADPKRHSAETHMKFYTSVKGGGALMSVKAPGQGFAAFTGFATAATTVKPATPAPAPAPPAKADSSDSDSSSSDDDGPSSSDSESEEETVDPEKAEFLAWKAAQAAKKDAPVAAESSDSSSSSDEEEAKPAPKAAAASSGSSSDSDSDMNDDDDAPAKKAAPVAADSSDSSSSDEEDSAPAAAPAAASTSSAKATPESAMAEIKADRAAWVAFLLAEGLSDTGNDPKRHDVAVHLKFWATKNGGAVPETKKPKAALPVVSSDSDDSDGSSSDEDSDSGDAAPAPTPAKKATPAPAAADSSDSSSSSDDEEEEVDEIAQLKAENEKLKQVAKQAEIDALKAENERLKQAEITKLKAENAKLRRASETVSVAAASSDSDSDSDSESSAAASEPSAPAAAADSSDSSSSDSESDHDEPAPKTAVAAASSDSSDDDDGSDSDSDSSSSSEDDTPAVPAKSNAPVPAGEPDEDGVLAFIKTKRALWLKHIQAIKLGDVGNDPRRHTDDTRRHFWRVQQPGYSAPAKATLKREAEPTPAPAPAAKKARPTPKPKPTPPKKIASLGEVKPWDGVGIDLNAYDDAAMLLQNQGADALKTELQRLGLKCGGKPIERAERLLATGGRAATELQSSFLLAEKAKVKTLALFALRMHSEHLAACKLLMVALYDCNYLFEVLARPRRADFYSFYGEVLLIDLSSTPQNRPMYTTPASNFPANSNRVVCFVFAYRRSCLARRCCVGMSSRSSRRRGLRRGCRPLRRLPRPRPKPRLRPR